MSKKAIRVFSRELKLKVVRRMLAGANVSALARELKVLRKDLQGCSSVEFPGGHERCAGVDHRHDLRGSRRMSRADGSRDHARCEELKRDCIRWSRSRAGGLLPSPLAEEKGGEGARSEDSRA